MAIVAWTLVWLHWNIVGHIKLEAAKTTSAAIAIGWLAATMIVIAGGW